MNSIGGSGRLPTRRAFLRCTATAAAAAACYGRAMVAAQSPESSSPGSMLRKTAAASGKTLGVYTVQHQLLNDPRASAMIADCFSLIADGNDLKFSARLRPTPTSFNFAPADAAVNWARLHKKLFRGHCLVWWNALPPWFHSYVTAENAHQVMVSHIQSVVGHYGDHVYSWDVVNEPIYHDGRADGLRVKPWLELLGPDYISLAFRTAAEQAPGTRRVLNECYIEHRTPQESLRRAQLLALVKRLVAERVPVTTVGIQGHLRGATPLDAEGLTDFMRQVKDLGLEIMVTELDVDDVGVRPSNISQVVADKYSQFLEIVDPYVRVITLEALEDDPAAPHVYNLFRQNPDPSGAGYEAAPAFSAAMRALRP